MRRSGRREEQDGQGGGRCHAMMEGVKGESSQTEEGLGVGLGVAETGLYLKRGLDGYDHSRVLYVSWKQIINILHVIS